MARNSAKLMRLRKKEKPATWEEALEYFLLRKQAAGLSTRTVEDYRWHVSAFFKRYPEALKESKLKQCILSYMSQKVKPATYNLRLVYLRTFYEWCVSEGVFQENPLAGFKKRKDEGRIAGLEEEVLVKLLSLPNRETFAGLRDYALILFTMDTGIRPSEAFHLMISDFNLRGLETYVRPEVAKTRGGRTLPMKPPTAQAVKELIMARHPAWGDDVPVFCSAEGTPLNRGTWRDRLEIYGKKLGKKIRPYDLRHSFALLYLRGGGDSFDLQKIMGHADLNMTKRYVALTKNDLRQRHTVASPVNRLLKQRFRQRKVSIL